MWSYYVSVLSPLSETHAAGLPGLLRGSVRNENSQECWESDGRETRTSLEQRHTGSTSATLQT